MHVIQQHKVKRQKQLVRTESSCFKGKETGHREQRGNKTWLFMSLTTISLFRLCTSVHWQGEYDENSRKPQSL